MFKTSPKQQAIAATRRNVKIGDTVTIDFGRFGKRYKIDGNVGRVVELLNLVNGHYTLYAVQYKNEEGHLMICDCPAWAIAKWTRQIAD